MKVQSTTQIVRIEPLKRKRKRNRRKRKRRNYKHFQKMIDFRSEMALLTSHFSFLTL